jgi:hypothetical protein
MIRACLLIVVCFSACLVGLSGCSSNGILGVDQCATVPSGAIPEPVGNKLCNWEIAQAVSAYADQLVFYKCDFVGHTADLSPSAKDRISSLAQLSATDTSSLPWVLEPSGSPELDQVRLDGVAFQLESLGLPSDFRDRKRKEQQEILGHRNQ